MPFSSITKPRHQEPRTVVSLRSVEALSLCTELLRAERQADRVGQVLADQAHRNFFPAHAAVFSVSGTEVRLIATASQSERFRRALEWRLRQDDSFSDVLLGTLECGRPTIHRLGSEDSVEDCLQLAYCSPLRGANPALLLLFLNADQRLGDDERAFLCALAEVGALALRSIADCPRNSDSDVVSSSRPVEGLYRELFDNIQEGAYFCAPDGRLLEVNDALVRMLGYNSREELLSVRANDLYVDPAHREITKRALDQFGRLRNHELALLRRDRSIIYVLENSFVVRDDAGQVIEYRGVLLDITEIKRVQSQLLREHDFNIQILNHTQSLIAVVDTAGLVSYANRRCSDVAAATERDLVGSRLESIVLPSHRPVLRGALECAIEGKAVSNLELPLVRGREPVGSFSVNLSPMRSARGEVNSVVAVMTDITDVATLQAKLMHAEKMAAVGQLVSGVAHEVNNPLTAILGFADLLLENPELPSSVKDDLHVIVQESQRTREIVQNLLSFARQTPPEKQHVDVNQVLRRTIALRSYDMASHGIELIEDFDSRLPEVIGDAHQLQQVFLNILNNACDAVRETHRHGTIVVTTQQSNSLIEVKFRDNGSGIRNPDRIFDPFYTTKDVGKGTGLGLSICYGIVREHSGEILCWNNDDSAGATFAIRLPLVQTTEKKPAARAALATR